MYMCMLWLVSQGYLEVKNFALEKNYDGFYAEVEAVTSDTPRKIQSPRQQVFMELVQTESNYVGILRTIMSVSTRNN